MSKSTSKIMFTGGPFGAKKAFQIYDPETKSFKETKAPPKPIDASMAITTHKKLFFAAGGVGNMDNIMTYNSESDSWKVAQVLKAPRSNAKAAFHKNKIYVVGGQDDSGAPVSSIEVFEFSDGKTSFMKRADVPWLNGDIKNYEVEAHNDKVYFIGGNDSSNDSLGKFSYFDLQNNETVELNPLLEGRSHCATVLWHNQIIALGGNAHADGTGALASVEAYSFKKFVWLNLPPLLGARATHSACLHDRKVWVIGGEDVIEAFDTDDAEWAAV